MARFTYKALNTSKQLVQGTIQARSQTEAVNLIAKQELSPLVIREVIEKQRFGGRISEVEKITFCRYVSAMLSSGLSLSEGIDVLQKETKNQLFKTLLNDISYSLEQGQQLSSVFERYPNVFESYFLTLTRAGEVSGTLAQVFKHLEVQMRSDYSLKSKIKGALLYPSVVFTAMIGIGFMMFFFILPQIGQVFLNLRITLPIYTRALFIVSIALSKFIIPIVIGMIVTVVLTLFLIRRRSVRNILFRMIAPFPIVKNLIKKIDVARFCRILSTLLKSAVPITEALEIALESMTWFEYQKLLKIVPDEIKKGKSLSSVIRPYKIFPSLLTQMIAAGEKTGTLDATLADSASFYEEEVEDELKNLTQILEPVLMLLVGIAVGIMILSIIAPIYGVVSNFQQAAGGK